MSRKHIQKDRPLPLKTERKKRAITERVFRRKDSSLWQAAFVGPAGKLVRRSTFTRNRDAAAECLALWKREAKRVSIPPPPAVVAPTGAGAVPELFDL